VEILLLMRVHRCMKLACSIPLCNNCSLLFIPVYKVLILVVISVVNASKHQWDITVCRFRVPHGCTTAHYRVVYLTTDWTYWHSHLCTYEVRIGGQDYSKGLSESSLVTYLCVVLLYYLCSYTSQHWDKNVSCHTILFTGRQPILSLSPTCPWLSVTRPVDIPVWGHCQE